MIATRQQRDTAPVALVQPSRAAVWGPVLAIAFIVLAITLVAITIVLALIPVYLSRRNTNTNTNTNTNAFTLQPATVRTSQVFSATYNVSWFNASPNGIERPILGLNRQLPGPTIRVRSGDIINITIVNYATDAISVHWHGMLQTGTTHMDGVPGVTQCSILPNQSFVYTFSTGNQSGTFWYHSHSGMQLGDGLQGPLIIEDPNDPWGSYYTDEDTLLLTDWYEIPLNLLLQGFLLAEAVEPTPVTGLINGIGQYNCTPSSTCTYYRTFITPGTTIRIRLINTSAIAKVVFSIDQHEMRVIEADGIPLDGTKISRVLRINAAQRYSVLVTAKANPAPSYWMRSTVLPVPIALGLYDPPIEPNISAILQYGTNHDPSVPVIVPSVATFNNDAVPIQQSFIEGEINTDEQGLNSMLNGTSIVFPNDRPPKTLVFNLAFNETDGQVVLTLNGETITTPPGQSLLAAVLTNNQAGINIPVNIQIESGDIIDLVINSIDFLGHPMHLHGHLSWLVAAGTFQSGYYTNETAPNIVLNTVNPVARDVISVNAMSYTIIRFKADNPGTWIIHCHNDWHLNLGMGLIFIESADQLRNYYNNLAPSIYIPKTCQGGAA